MGRTIGRFRVEVTYSLGKDLDQKITELAGKPDWASGGGFGCRDLSFDFATRRLAEAAAQRIELAHLPTVEVTLYEAKPD